VRISVSQRESENLERMKISFERWSKRGSFGSLVRSFKLCTCESRFIKKNKRSALKIILVQKAKRMRTLRPTALSELIL
jgi:hypothetical protein